jgi:hypothetical protein
MFEGRVVRKIFKSRTEKVKEIGENCSEKLHD